MQLWPTIKKALPITLVSIILILVFTLQQVYFKKLGYSLGPWPYFILITISFAFVPIFFVVLIASRLIFGPIDKEGKSLKFKLRFVIIGIFLAFNGVGIIFSNPHVPGTLQAVFLQAVVPAVIILSIIFLRARYTILQYVAAVVILGGLALDIYAQVRASESSGEGSEAGFSLGLLLWCLCFILAQIPTAAASVYEEFAFGKASISIPYLMAWSSLAQFVTLVLCLPLNFIPGFGGIPVNQTAEFFAGAARCLFTPEHQQADQYNPYCHTAWSDWLMATGMMLLSQVVQAVLVKISSATLSILVLTLVTPLSSFAFTQRWLMGSEVEAMPWLEWIALVLIMIGLAGYRLEEYRQKRKSRGSAETDFSTPYYSRMEEQGERDFLINK